MTTSSEFFMTSHFSSSQSLNISPAGPTAASTQEQQEQQEPQVLTMPTGKKGTYISRLVVCLEGCLKKLGVTVATHPTTLLPQLEQMARLIHESMSISSRNYHSVQHVFDVAENLDNAGDPIAVIAALFHDCVYYHVDGGLSDLQWEKLKGAVEDSTSDDTSGGVQIPVYRTTQETTKASACGDDELLCLVEAIFGYKKGQHVNHQNGLNEFLSAVICVRELKDFLPKPVLAQIACCIEATIPFRAKDKETGQTCMEKLYIKFSSANEQFGLGFDEAELVQSVQRAADLGCSDVANFGTTDLLWFLDNTWSLLPESNEGLRRQYLYSVQQFQFAVFKMHGFFHFLTATVVFPFYKDVPAPAVYARRVENARRNLQVGRKYVGAKLLSLSVLAAFAELTGGDAPISLFVGDLPSRHSGQPSAGHNKLGRRHSSRERLALEEPNQLPYTLSTDDMSTDVDATVYEVLSQGRRTETNFDVKQSPMASYLYAILGDAEMSAVLKDIKVYPMTPDTARLLLRRLPRSVVVEVSKNVSEVAYSRSERIATLMETL